MSVDLESQPDATPSAYGIAIRRLGRRSECKTGGGPLREDMNGRESYPLECTVKS